LTAYEDRLVSVGMMAPLDSNEFLFAEPYIDLRRNPGPFEKVTAFQAGAYACDLTERDPVRMRCLRVEANFFETLGVRLPFGRTFTAEEDRPNGPRVALLSHGVWQTRFGADPSAVGKILTIDGEPLVIAGVLSRDFETPTLTHACNDKYPATYYATNCGGGDWCEAQFCEACPECQVRCSCDKVYCPCSGGQFLYIPVCWADGCAGEGHASLRGLPQPHSA
jgi:hypothetical protein